MRRQLFLTACLVGIFVAPVGARGADLPNIIFVMMDDMGYGDLGAYNAESKVPTPHMDRLAREGMRFTDAHSPSAVCTPTRYGVLTGRYSWRTRMKSGVLNGYSPSLIDESRLTVASLLKRKGYTTGAVGKWHLGFQAQKRTDYDKPLRPGPVTLGFDYFWGIPASLDMTPYVFVENDRPIQKATANVKGSKMRRHDGGGFWRGGAIAPDFKHIDVLPRITEKAVGFIEREAKKKDAPFFLYFPLASPHTPWLPTEEFVGKTGAGPYGDFTHECDWAVGRVLDALDRTGQTKSTLVFVTSDNGAHWLPSDIEKYGHRANRHLRGQKADIHEGGHRVAFLARWPGKIAAGSTSDETICHTDLLATAAEIVGVDLPKDAGEDSYSILPALVGTKLERPIREATVHHSLSGMFAIRQGRWKLIEGRGTGGFTAPRRVKPKEGEPKGQLYDLEADPSEKSNLWSQKPEVVAKLTKLLDRYRKSGRSRP